MCCLLWVQSIKLRYAGSFFLWVESTANRTMSVRYGLSFLSAEYDLYSISVIAMLYVVTSCCIWPCYKGTPLQLECCMSLWKKCDYWYNVTACIDITVSVGFVWNRCNSSVQAGELSLFHTNLLIWISFKLTSLIMKCVWLGTTTIIICSP